MQLSPHFSLKEMLKSETAEEKHISNVANEEAIANLKALCLNVLPTSQHLKGQACDILQKKGGRKEHLKLFHLIQSLGLPFDQLIWEDDGVWIHVSYRADDKNRGQILYK